ncbi:MAG: hypothetical protein ABI923_05650 [bacterium]
MLKQIMSVVTMSRRVMRKLIAPAPRQVVEFITLRCGGRRAVAIWLATAMLNLCTTAAFASPRLDSPLATGMTTVKGVVTIDGSPAISGQTIFSGSSIVTAERSESTLYFGNLTRLNLYDESKLTLEFSNSTLSGSLEKGSVRGFVPGSVRVDIVTADASISTDPRQPSAFSVQVESHNTTISVETGRVEIRTGNSLRSVMAGESFSTGNGAPLLPGPQQNSNNRRMLWLFLGIGAAVAVLVVAITGRDNEPPCEGGAVILSPTTGGPGICQ